MRHEDNGCSFDHTDPLPTGFIFYYTVLPDENVRIIEDLGSDLEPDAMLPEVGLSLLWIPSEAGHLARL